MDTVTGKIYYGQNSALPPSPLQSQLAGRLASYLQELDGYRIPLKGEPGAHSEIYALNQGFQVRPEADFEDFLVYNLRLKGTAKGKPIVRCGNCASITKGVTDIS
jgi:hypothetical protein